MISIVICFSGRIAIGKTSVSKALAKELNCPWTGFGDYLRAVATKRGLNAEDRDQLQRLGESTIQEHGFEWFCKEVIAAANWMGDSPLVIDGIRHVEAFQTVARLLASHKSVLIHLAIDSEETLRSRAVQRGIDLPRRAAWETHSTEQQVLGMLPSIADLIVPADLPLDEITTRILSYVTRATQK
jgi:cytidylate kinase